MQRIGRVCICTISTCGAGRRCNTASRNQNLYAAWTGWVFSWAFEALFSRLDTITFCYPVNGSFLIDKQVYHLPLARNNADVPFNAIVTTETEIDMTWIVTTV
jgi:hypothetical protein